MSTHQIVLEMTDPTSPRVGAAITEAYRDTKFHGVVQCNMTTGTGDWKMRIQGPTIPLLLEFASLMHYAMATEPQPKAPEPEFSSAVSAPQKGWIVPEAEAQIQTENEVDDSSPLDSTEQEDEEIPDEDEEDEDYKEEESGSEEAEQDAPVKANRPDPNTVLRVPRSFKGGSSNVQKTGHRAVTIEG